MLEGPDKIFIDKVLSNIKDRSYLENVQRDHIWGSEGCDKCHHSGFKGRIGIYEAILIDDSIEKAVLNNPSEHEIEEAAKSQNMLTMVEDGVLKILSGQTSVSELARVVDISSI